MGLVRAKKDVYLNEHGYHAKGSEFEYNGPDNENLESVEAGPYNDFSDAELRDEIRRRGLTYVAVATKKDLEAVLAEDDAKPKESVVQPRARKPKQGPRDPKQGSDPAQDDGNAEDGSGSGRYGASDWTAAGQDGEGFPVEKGSATDVS
jgi:hypothetical protein